MSFIGNSAHPLILVCSVAEVFFTRSRTEVRPVNGLAVLACLHMPYTWHFRALQVQLRIFSPQFVPSAHSTLGTATTSMALPAWAPRSLNTRGVQLGGGSAILSIPPSLISLADPRNELIFRDLLEPERLEP